MILNFMINDIDEFQPAGTLWRTQVLARKRVGKEIFFINLSTINQLAIGFPHIGTDSRRE